MKRFAAAVLIGVLAAGLSVIVQPSEAFTQRQQAQAPGNGGGRGGGGGGETENAVSVMMRDDAGDGIRSDGIDGGWYANDVDAVEARINTSGELMFIFGQASQGATDRGLVYDFTNEYLPASCLDDGSCTCDTSVLVHGAAGGWLRINQDDVVQLGMWDIDPGDTVHMRLVGSIPGLGEPTGKGKKKTPGACALRSRTDEGLPMDGVSVTRVDTTTWTIESAGQHVSQYTNGSDGGHIDHGYFTMPFAMTVQCLDSGNCAQ